MNPQWTASGAEGECTQPFILEMSLDDFVTVAKLGEGAFSSVYKVRRKKDNQFYALKQVSVTRLSNKDRANALNEVRLLASLRHPNVVSYKEAFVLEDGETLW